MTQKILVAIDDSENALRAAEFVARHFSQANHITLLNIMLDTAALCNMDSPELIPLFKSQQTSFCSLEDKKRELVEQAMKKAKGILLSAGFSSDQLTTKIENKRHSVAKDILEEAKDGYDLIVMGRRGVSGIKEFFLGSTSQKVFNGAREISVLIVN